MLTLPPTCPPLLCITCPHTAAYQYILSVKAHRSRWLTRTIKTIRALLLVASEDDTVILSEVDSLEKYIQSLLSNQSLPRSKYMDLPLIYTAACSNLPEGYTLSPTFELMMEPTANGSGLENIDVTRMISDLDGRSFWSSRIGKSVSSTPFYNFVSQWNSAMSHDEGRLRPNEVDLLKDILDTSEENNEPIVTSYAFSLFLNMFGPFTLCRERVMSCTSELWFCGAISATQTMVAFKQPINQKVGKFLVRYSQSDPGRLIVTYVDASNYLRNDKIYNMGSLGYSLSNTITGARYETISDLIRCQR
jgi:hypothetical protein